MPTYGKNKFKESNVNYLGKDFTALKTSLMSYAKSYFPNTYRDFNETSPGMMLIEMNAYVGDVLSFYIDQQYREMLLPLAEERRNVINMAKMFGYKVKPIVPSYVDLTFKQDLDVSSTDSSKVDYSSGGIFDSGMQIKGTNSNVVFETLDIVDFQVSQSNDTVTPSSFDQTTGLASGYTLERTVKAVSGKTKSSTFTIGAPEKFKKITISDTNVIDIISCVDSNGNKWYEVDFLAQDKVPIPTHYTVDENRNSAYGSLTDNSISTLPVPYSLTYIKTNKRFTRETNLDNTTSLVFGNGVLRDGKDGSVDQGYIDMDQIGIVIPGQTNDLNNSINPLLGDEYSTLGETPNNTTLTITYRVGGGIASNIAAADLNEVLSGQVMNGSADGVTIGDLTVTNRYPAIGGRDEESVDEIKEKAKAFFSTQNRCVTKEDYEARVMNIPSKFGNIAKVYCVRSGDDIQSSEMQQNFQQSLNQVSLIYSNTLTQLESLRSNVESMIGEPIDNSLHTGIENIQNTVAEMVNPLDVLQDNSDLTTFDISSIKIYVLAYDINKNLVGNPMTAYTSVTDSIPSTLMSNIKNYLGNFKILTDNIQILDGYIVNFAVFFDVVADKDADKKQVKFKCIDKIKDYFRVEKMQFNQPIFKSQLEYELMDVEGVRAVNHVTITQETDYHEYANGETTPATYTYSYSEEVDVDNNPENGVSGGYQASEFGNDGYGYNYDFQNALVDGIIRPPEPSTPAVFELKNPNQNIQGRVR